MKDIIFLTGATGFLGTQIAQQLIKKYNVNIVVLVRGKNYDDAYKHLTRVWWEFPELIEEIKGIKKVNDDNIDENKIYLVNGNITKENLGLNSYEYNFLLNNITHIIHAAADIRLNMPLDDLRKVNVQGTLNLLKFAEDINKNHDIKRFSYLSKAYVAGGQKDIIFEDILTDEYGFLSNYERSKYEGELKVRNSNLPVSIFRPGMIIGDSKTGYIKTFNTIYVLIRLYLNNQLHLLPVSKDSKLNIVPVDYVAESVVKLTFDKNTENKTFHLTAPYSSLPTIEDFLYYIQDWTLTNMNIKLSKPFFLPISLLNPKIVTILKYLGQNSEGLGKTIVELAPYMNEDRKFSRDNTQKFLGSYTLQLKKFMHIILDYAIYNGFFHRSQRTVHEQVLFRLKSKSRPVQYYDIVEGQFLKRKKSDIINDILKGVRSLKNLGINPGDKIAVIGFNSTRYLILDISIGLVGAVNVPIYYTSPVNEINEIIKDCGAKIIFIGAPNLLTSLNDMKLGNYIISFCNENIKIPSNILSWKEFIGNKNAKKSNNIFAPVNFDDIATIRYTSGTTGKPLGVSFTHGNLRWMAEYISSMPPWADRNKKISYLSFLPMNHVVEGILGTYSPYYAPAPLYLYFLENFKDLETSLPQVKPTIFFSVPRFYEKIWTKILESSIGDI
ncbi:MAG: SDR family oxidoreductase [Methanobacterium sp.]|nr:SDR family oxidoreductase [Methanobacterium sp.]